jgi:hypothetical protein
LFTVRRGAARGISRGADREANIVKKLYSKNFKLVDGYMFLVKKKKKKQNLTNVLICFLKQI